MIKPSFFTEIKTLDDTYGKFIISPLPFSFGHSIGNALRRTLLSALKGAAVIQVKIEGAPHLFSTISGVKESVLEIVLNLKQLRFKVDSDGDFVMHLEAKGKGKVYGKDIKGEIEIVNKDLYIAELTTSSASLKIELVVRRGWGKLEAEEQEKRRLGYIPVDAYFSPVRKVNCEVKEARVGRKSNFDKLILEITTDGSISPKNALQSAALILSEFFGYVLSGRDKKESTEEDKKVEEKKVLEKKLDNIIIDELNLPSRVVNALLRAKIETVADLVKTGRDKLVNLKGVGKKSLSLIEEELKKLEIEFK